MKAFIYDVFGGESAKGNPCGVLELEQWLTDSELLEVTHQLAQPITAFVVKSGNDFDIRWFGLDGEINLCGHGSLGAGTGLIEKYKFNEVTLNSDYGKVVISRKGNLSQIELPSWEGKPYSQLSGVPIDLAALNQSVIEVFSTRDLILVLDSEDAVKNFSPDFEQYEKLQDLHAVMVTAKSSDDSYVLRYFAPKIGISEDLATGSAQCSLAPYWFDKLGKDKLSVRQLSSSGGCFEVERKTDSSIVVLARVERRP
ncbi:PhzF family phenazine biosynthesis protein [Vibrio echinoideorum]|uniref:PhzF family phenazine biosynthesis protein n=1 Tax=Vibrio echinoideorum TaxID=2100116 RepID=UPI003551D790